MRQFHAFIDDDRYSEPAEFTLQVASESRARQIAERFLAASPHHRGVEICEHGERLFGLGTFATRTWCGVKSRQGWRERLASATEDVWRLLRSGLDPRAEPQCGIGGAISSQPTKAISARMVRPTAASGP